MASSTTSNENPQERLDQEIDDFKEPEITVIQRIKPDSSYSLDLELRQEVLFPIIEFLRTKELTPKTVLKFVRRNEDSLAYILKVVPYPVLLRLYQHWGFLKHYWSEQIIDELVKKSQERFMIWVFMERPEIYLQYLVNLRDQVNMQFNFTKKVFRQRYLRFKEAVKIVNLDDFYLGTGLVLLLGGHMSQHDKVNLLVYPKTREIIFDRTQNIQVYFEGDLFWFKLDNYLIQIQARTISHIGQIFYLYGEDVVYDGDNIWCLPRFYQTGLINQSSKPDLTQTSTSSIYQWEKKRLSSIQRLKTPFNLVRCYECHQVYDREVTLDRYIDMCLNCGLFNYQKRELKANLTGVSALVTGIRQKIGFHITLKLLRCGARVIGTTRFPNSTWYNYSSQPDYEEWKERLIIYPCQFLDLKQVSNLIAFARTQQVSILINSACQTIRPSHMYQNKIKKLENILEQQLSGLLVFGERRQLLISNQSSTQSSDLVIVTQDQRALINQQLESHDIIFNQFGEIYDEDIKKESSWMQQIGDLEPAEIMEVVIINQTVPILLVTGLRNHMTKPTFIINVTAKEGQFSCKKEATHPHTNMCKAALNMMIRTMAEEEDPDLWVYAIDPGFVSGVNPQLDHYPLGPADGATRILDPIIQYYVGRPLPRDREWVHLRNYKPAPW